VEEDATGAAPARAVGEHQPPGCLDLLGPREKGTRPVGAELADDAANLSERAALCLAELGSDLLGGPPLLRSQAWAGRTAWPRIMWRVILPVAIVG